MWPALWYHGLVGRTIGHVQNRSEENPPTTSMGISLVFGPIRLSVLDICY